MSQGLLTIDQTLTRLAGDRNLLAKLFRLYLEETPKKLTALDAAWAAHETYQVERLAHSIKGASATVGALALQQAAMALETATKTQDLAAMEAAYTQVRSLASETMAAMESFCATV